MALSQRGRKFTVLISPTAFKGTLTPSEAATIIRQTLSRIKPHWNLISLPLADGGDGTLDVLESCFKSTQHISTVQGPLGQETRAKWTLAKKTGSFLRRTAIIEMARASGLALVKGKNNIMKATSVGTGQLIKAALDHNCQTILIGVGGTATAEGGAGALQALGFRYFDRKGQILSSTPLDLLKLSRVDRTKVDLHLRKTKIIVLCDVSNPLLGPSGSARTFGPQKGATASQVELLEKVLKHWATFALVQTKNVPGAGAAGALAYGLSAFLHAQLVPGAPFIMRILKWKEMAQRADLIITGEGQIDKTSFSGKVIGEIVRHRGRAKVVALCGKMILSNTERYGLDLVKEMGSKGLRSPKKMLAEITQELFR